MRILVIDDNPLHHSSAIETLSGHDVTIVSSFDEGIDLLAMKIDKENVARLLAEAGFPKEPDRQAVSAEVWRLYWKTKDEAEAQVQSIILLPFEAVLVDMMMPMSRRTLISEAYKPGEQVPYGFILALRAALCGAKFVAMVTDTNHHRGAMSAALDHLGGAYYCSGFKPNFAINGARVVFVHAPFVEDVVKDAPCTWCQEKPGVCNTCLGSGTNRYGGGRCNSCAEDVGKCRNCKGTTKADTTVHERKDWGKVFRDLTS